MKKAKSSRVAFVAATLAGASLIQGGCAHYSMKAQGMDNSLRQMDVPGASTAALASFEKNNGKDDHVVTLLELSTTTRLSGMYYCERGKPSLAAQLAVMPDRYTPFALLPIDDPFRVETPSSEQFFKISTRGFEEVNRSFEFWDSQPEISITEQMSGLLANQTFTKYRGTYSDRVMAQIYLALDYLQQGDYDNARVAFNRMHYELDSAIVRNEKELANAQMLAQNAMNGAQTPEGQSGSYDVTSAQQDPSVQAQMNRQFAGLSALEPYGNFANPFGYWLEAVFLLHCAETPGDMETALKNMQLVYGMTSQNSHSLQALSQAQKVVESARTLEGQTYVIIETGRAPILEEVRIDIPLFVYVEDTNLPYVGAAFPRLVTRAEYVRNFSISADGQTHTAQMLCSMDRVMGEEFNRRFPVILTKALISAGIKGTIAYYANKELETGDYLHDLLVKAATSVLQAALNSADTRSWHTLPKEFLVAQFPTPESRSITISTPGNEHQPLVIELQDGASNVVFVRSAGPNTPLLATQFILDRSLIGRPPGTTLATAR